jgi:endonuclease/exonuclease/phosphatase family metal-dependent hydrolase
MTYNVKGLPWPLASERPAALRQIGHRLARLRARHLQPDIVVLQEAFTPEAKQIARLSGYPYIVEGAHTRAAPGRRERANRNWLLGETQPAIVDSGLIILSDLPVLTVARASFPPSACAGWDCLAAKGVAMITVNVPNKGPLTVATAHLNCQGASGASKRRATQAYVRQVRFLSAYLSAKRHSNAPLIVAGDFNLGRRPQRIAALHAALTHVAGHHTPTDAITRTLRGPAASRSQDPDLRLIHSRARDLQYAFAGGDLEATPIAADVPFGTELDGSTLSDHMGYTVHYQLRTPS